MLPFALLACVHKPPVAPTDVPTVAVEDLTSPLVLPEHLTVVMYRDEPALVYAGGALVTGPLEAQQTWVSTVLLTCPASAQVLRQQTRMDLAGGAMFWSGIILSISSGWLVDLPREADAALAASSIGLVLGGVFLPEFAPTFDDAVSAYNVWAAQYPDGNPGSVVPSSN